MWWLYFSKIYGALYSLKSASLIKHQFLTKKSKMPFKHTCIPPVEWDLLIISAECKAEFLPSSRALLMRYTPLMGTVCMKHLHPVLNSKGWSIPISKAQRGSCLSVFFGKKIIFINRGNKILTDGIMKLGPVLARIHFWTYLGHRRPGWSLSALPL